MTKAEKDFAVDLLKEKNAEIETLRAREAELTAALMATAEASATHLKRATELQAAISDPVSVHVNMLRGSIAKLQPENIWHLYGENLLDAMPTEFRDRLGAELQRKLDAAVEILAVARAEADENIPPLGIRPPKYGYPDHRVETRPDGLSPKSDLNVERTGHDL